MNAFAQLAQQVQAPLAPPKVRRGVPKGHHLTLRVFPKPEEAHRAFLEEPFGTKLHASRRIQAGNREILFVTCMNLADAQCYAGLRFHKVEFLGSMPPTDEAQQFLRVLLKRLRR